MVDGDPNTGIIHALIHLPFLNDAYLLAVRQADPKVFGYYTRTKVAVSEYNRLDQNRSRVSLIFRAALCGGDTWWCCLPPSGRASGPPTGWCGQSPGLIDAAGPRIRGRSFSAQVRVEREDDELGNLGVAFNRMTQQLSAQRADLVDANRQIDIRRLFTETVLSGVSAGVIGIDHDGRHHNRQPRRRALVERSTRRP